MIDKKRDGNLNKVLLADVAIEIIPSNESSNENFRRASQVEFDANNGLSLNQSDASLQINTFESFEDFDEGLPCLLYTSPSPRDYAASRMPSSA